VSIKSFPDYKHLLQENYVEYKHIFYRFNVHGCVHHNNILAYNSN